TGYDWRVALQIEHDGESFAMKPMLAYGRTEIRSYTMMGSEEKIVAFGKIMRTTNVDVDCEGGTLADTKSAPDHVVDRGLRSSLRQLNTNDGHIGTAR
ncbi:hypothetical protein ACHAQA_009002, partial [Verticillium albo-atrum]